MSAAKSFLITPVIMFVFLCGPSSARIIYVPADFGTIQAAVNDANSGDSVILADGIYTGDGNRDVDFLGKAITVRSRNGSGNCIIDCNGSQADPHRAFLFQNGEDANSVLDGFTIRNGYAADGGGILCQSAGPTITNCTFVKNSADGNNYGGGAICALYGTPTLTNCTFSQNITYQGCGGAVCNYGSNSNAAIVDCTFTENSARGDDGGCGGAVYNWQIDGSLAVTNCTFSKNSASSTLGGGGGAICLVSGTAVVANCTFRDNYTDRLGGALWCVGCNPGTKVADCTFTSNSAAGGGAICNSDCSPLITSCAFMANSANGPRFYSGGAILNWGAGAPATVTNCTFSSNTAYDGSAKGFGGAICAYMQTSSIINCILYGNTAPDGNELSLLALGAADVNYCDINDDSVYVGPGHTLNSGPGNIDLDPCFAVIGYWDPNGTPDDANDDFWVDGDYHLLPDSPCINSGDPNYIPEPNETDLDGNPRVAFGRIDMGAYEFNNTPPVAVTGPNQTAYAFIDGLADVALDGSASYDDDNDVLSYYWSWTVDGNLFEANGVSPTIELPVGQHQIQLIIDDGIDLSEPNYCTVNVISALRANLFLSPCVLNTCSRGGWIVALLALPNEISRSDVDRSEPLTFYPGQIESRYQWVYETRTGRRHCKRTYIMAWFRRTDCVANLSSGANTVQIEGRLTTGRYFYGTSKIYLITPIPHRSKHPRFKK